MSSIEIDHTHRLSATSWVASAQSPGTDFPIQNLPFGVFKGRANVPQIGIAIGDHVLSLPRAFQAGLLPGLGHLADACDAPGLNALMALGRTAWRELRHAVFELLRTGSPAHAHSDALLERMDEVEMLLPAQLGDFTDFFTSIHHARRTGEMFRPDTPLQPNFVHLPVAYHGRASSVVVSGTPCRRPRGQTGAAGQVASYAPSQRLDFELEVGFFVGPGNALGSPIGIEQAEDHIFGLCLVNDWSARDIQRWESQPLGPFLAKSFMTSISPWVITLEALAPFRCAPVPRGEGVPDLAAALDGPLHAKAGGIDISLTASLQTKRMRIDGIDPLVIASPRFADQYWTIFQMLTHHASNGCNLRTGDLLSSGTVSGPEQKDSGCLLELTWNGTEPLALPSGEERVYLQDGDRMALHGRCVREGFRTIGLGRCEAEILPSI